jgi:hypothetical protein
MVNLTEKQAKEQILLCLQALPLDSRQFNLDALSEMIAKNLVIYSNNVKDIKVT